MRNQKYIGVGSRRQAGLGSIGAALVTLATFVASAGTARAAEWDQAAKFDIPAQALDTALLEFSKQAGIQVLATTQTVAGKTTGGVKGEIIVEKALDALLKGSGLQYRQTGSHAVTVGLSADKEAAAGQPKLEMRLAQADASNPADATGEKLEEVFVRGKPFTDANVDIVRTENDPQPYYIFKGEEIEKANVVNLEEFLNQKLTMNAASTALSQNAIVAPASRVNLRGVGFDQTLILVNGRRTAGTSTGGGFAYIYQFDLNAFAPSMIDRIEVLPSSASAIYGGSAVGGVLNVVLKRDFTGGEIKLAYDTPLDTNAPIRSVVGGYGWSLEDGRTNITISGSYRDGKSLSLGERPELLQRGVSRILERSPTLLYSPGTPFEFGTTPNVSSVDGSPLVFKDGTPLGSSMTFIPTGTSAGTSAPDLQAGLLSNAGQQNTALANTYLPNGLQRPFSFPNEAKSVAAALRRKMTDRLELMAEVFYNKNEASGPLTYGWYSGTPISADVAANPFSQDIVMSVPFPNTSEAGGWQETKRMVAGFVLDLPRDWRAQGDYTWNRNEGFWKLRLFDIAFDQTDYFADVANGTVNPFVDTLAHPLNLSPYLSSADDTTYGAATTLSDVALRVSGPIGHLPAGRPNLTIGLADRDEKQPWAYRDFLAYGLQTYLPQSQKVKSVYAEALVPVIAAVNNVPGIRLLDLQIAGRLEDFSVNTSTGLRITRPPDYATDPDEVLVHEKVNYKATNKTFAIRYKPVDSLTLRTSYSTAFLPPSSDQLLPATTNPFGVPFDGLRDPRRGYEVFSTSYKEGGNPDLDPMDAKSLNIGLLFEPTFWKGMRAGLEWFRIKRDNLIFFPTFDQLLADEAAYPGRVERAAPSPGDPYDVGPVTFIDLSSVNAQHVSTDGVDISLGYSRETERHGVYSLDLLGTVIDSFTRRVALNSSEEEIAGQIANQGPLKLRVNATLGWQQGPWSLGWTALYYGSYDQFDSPLYIAAQGSTTVPHQIYHNFLAGYQFAENEGASGANRALSNVTVTLGIRNVFNTVPPFDAYQTQAGSTPGYTVFYSQFGDYRLRSVQLSFGKRF